jgi:hypothetical protein
VDECTRYSGKLKEMDEQQKPGKEGKMKGGKDGRKSGLVPSVPQARFVGVVMWGSYAHGASAQGKE